jgi:hypothetical protein
MSVGLRISNLGTDCKYYDSVSTEDTQKCKRVEETPDNPQQIATQAQAVTEANSP